MKNKFVLIALVLATIFSLKYSSGPASIVGQGYTGAPGESGTLCGDCHSGGAFGSPTASLVVTDSGGGVVTSYTAGETYQISLTAIAGSGSPAGYGFQLTVLDGSDNDVADFSNPSGNAKISTAASVAGGRTYAEHNATSATGTFTFDWVAPVGGTGDLTFYYNVNLVDGTGGTSADNGGLGYSTAMGEAMPTVKVIGALEVNNAYTLPATDGSANQVLTTDGAGSVSWMDAPSSIAGSTTTSESAKDPNIPFFDNKTNKEDIDILKNEVVLLKSEIEALKKLIEKLTEE